VPLAMLEREGGSAPPWMRPAMRACCGPPSSAEPVCRATRRRGGRVGWPRPPRGMQRASLCVGQPRRVATPPEGNAASIAACLAAVSGGRCAVWALHHKSTGCRSGGWCAPTVG
jgi:hypothetical protein